MDDPAMNDDPAQQPYQFYHPDANDQYSIGPYNPYPPALHHQAARSHIVQDVSYHNIPPLGLSHHQHQYQSGVFSASEPHVSLPLAVSPPPPSPEMYDPLSPPLSGSDTSADQIPFPHHHSNSNSSGANSPASSSRAHSLVHRSTPRYNPTPSPTTSSSAGRRRSRSRDSDDEELMGVTYVENLAHSRKEATRRQRIEAEQRRRDELRDGYAKLKDALPVSNQKSSKVSLLERATNHIIELERLNKELQQRIAFIESESQRLRALNEKISLNSEGTASPDATMGRSSEPPTADATPAPPTHNLASVRGQQPPSEHSSPSSASEA